MLLSLGIWSFRRTHYLNVWTSCICRWLFTTYTLNVSRWRIYLEMSYECFFYKLLITYSPHFPPPLSPKGPSGHLANFLKFINFQGAKKLIPRNHLRQHMLPEPVFVNPFRSPESIPSLAGKYDKPYSLYRPSRLPMLAVSIPRNWFLGSINVYKYGLSIPPLRPPPPPTQLGQIASGWHLTWFSSGCNSYNYNKF